jgi:hypothetical protein
VIHIVKTGDITLPALLLSGPPATGTDLISSASWALALKLLMLLLARASASAAAAAAAAAALPPPPKKNEAFRMELLPACLLAATAAAAAAAAASAAPPVGSPYSIHAEKFGYSCVGMGASQCVQTAWCRKPEPARPSPSRALPLPHI